SVTPQARVQERTFVRHLLIIISDIEQIKKPPKKHKPHQKPIQFHLHTPITQIHPIPNIPSYLQQPPHYPHSPIPLTHHNVL
ncbi:hypothetical protein, partial [Staphylococcus capitis]|uniref:hypothetical protein n=1 Tax=Staphylococcus capitis TaxID=29388 RepID=UPI001C92D0ED